MRKSVDFSRSNTARDLTYNKNKVRMKGITESKAKIIWEAFGLYIRNTLRDGRGVQIPKFGTFTFTNQFVDLAGSTNPHDRDRQLRFPVFVVASEFGGTALTLRPGIVSGMTPDVYDPEYIKNQNQLRIYGNKGQEGIIPKVKVNFIQIAAVTKGVADREACKNYIEEQIKRLSDSARSSQINETIPWVGKLVVKNQVAGVVFKQQVLEDTREQTVKQYSSKLWAQNNWMNDKIHEPNYCNYQDVPLEEVVDFRPFQVSKDAGQWMKDNLDMEDKVFSPLVKQKNKRLMSATSSRRDKMQSAVSQRQATVQYADPFASPDHRSPYKNANTLRDNTSMMNGRPQRSRPGTAVSRFSQSSSMFSQPPELAPFELMNLANELFQFRQKIIKSISSQPTLTVRLTLTTTQINNVLASVGCKMHIGSLRALLKELGFMWKGQSCSLQQLILNLKDYLNPQAQAPLSVFQDDQEIVQKKEEHNQKLELLAVKSKNGKTSVIDVMKDLFYNSGLSCYNMFREVQSKDTINKEQITNFVANLAEKYISHRDIEAAFDQVFKNKSTITFQEFEKIFNHVVPKSEVFDNQVGIIKKVRDWMFQRQYSSGTAFDRLIRASNRMHERSLRKIDLHKGVVHNQVRLNAPEIDCLFDIISDKQSDTITLEDWLNKIYDDCCNPLQQIREVVQSQFLSVDDVLFQMKLKAWDDPIDYNKFEKALHLLDPSFSPSQCKALFSKLKNEENQVPVEQMISNFAGTFQDTVDFKNKMFKLLHTKIHSMNKQDLMIKELEKIDKNFDGKVTPQDLQTLLIKMTQGQKKTESMRQTKQNLDQDETIQSLKKNEGIIFDRETLQKFTRQLHKDNNFKIDYLDLIEQIASVGPDSNPFKVLMQRVAFFLEQNKLNISTLLARLTQDHQPVTVGRFAEFLHKKIDKDKELNILTKHSAQIDIDHDGIISPEDLTTCLRNLNSKIFYQTFSEQSPSELSRKSMGSNCELNDQMVLDFCNKIRNELKSQRISLRALWNKLDTSNQGLVNMSQFIRGMNKLTQVTAPILEQVFCLMDQNGIGLIDFKKLNDLLCIQTINEIKQQSRDLGDNFFWQEQVISKIRNWVTFKKISFQEAFKLFDKDFDGFVSTADLKKSLVEYIGIKADEITQNRLNRIQKLLSFNKSEFIQLSDFQRLLGDIQIDKFGITNPSFADIRDMFSWQKAAIQQIGLKISQKYKTIEDSFRFAAGLLAQQTQDKQVKQKQRVNFEQFDEFVRQTDVLQGFNLTKQLMLIVFSTLDPHKKTFLTLKDWISSFSQFNQYENLLNEVKANLCCKFKDADSAFAYITSFEPCVNVNLTTFKKAIHDLLPKRLIGSVELKHAYQSIAHEQHHFSLKDFKREFASSNFIGRQGKTKNRPQSAYLTQPRPLTTKFEVDPIDKIRRLLKSSNKKIESIFTKVSVNMEGIVSQKEFVKAIKLLSIDFTEMEINRLIKQLNPDMSTSINVNDFCDIFKEQKDIDNQMLQRAMPRLQQMNKQMSFYMKTSIEAFKMFERTDGRLGFNEFQALVKKLCQHSNEEVPCNSVIRDLFDVIDSNKDNFIDHNEWIELFGKAIRGSSASTQVSFTNWQQSLEGQQMATCLARNRRQLIENFNGVSTHSSHDGQARFVTFDQAKRALLPILEQAHYDQVNDGKIECLLQVGKVQRRGSNTDIKLYDFRKIVDIYQNRHQAPLFK